jgi:phospholipase/carboxylesterase
MNRPLIVALHGVGSSGRDLAAALAPVAPISEVIALDGLDPFDGGGRGRQWFSVAGVTELDRPRRVAQSIPKLVGQLDAVARDYGVAREEMVLLGFSQGAIMTLALGRAVAIAGRLASPIVPVVGDPATLLLVADRTDRVMPPALSEAAADRLGAAGHHARLIVTDGVGHGVGRDTLETIAGWLTATAARSALTSN